MRAKKRALSPKLERSAQPRSVLDDIFLRKLVRDIVRGTVVASLTAAAGCADSDALRPLDDSYIEPTCTDEGWLGLSAVAPAEPFDAAALRTVSPGQASDQSQVGEPCGNASDAAACNLAWTDAGVGDPDVGQLRPGMAVIRSYLVVNRGDDVAVVGERAELLELLGAIDTEDEAILLAYWDGYEMRCNSQALSSAKALDDGSFMVVGTRTTSSCLPIEEKRFTLRIAPDGAIEELDAEVVSTEEGACAGRKPEGLRPTSPLRAGALADYFARSAHLEAASVIAFELLAEELSAHGAPAALVGLAHQFARDEARHTTQVTRLAERFGGRVEAPIVARRAARCLEAIALENAVEGCVRESYGALLGAYQAEAARDPEIAACMATLAGDELRHASWSHALDAWVMPQLSAEARARVRAAQRAALAELRHAIAAPLDPQLHERAGIPNAPAAHRLIDALAAQLAWA